MNPLQIGIMADEGVDTISAYTLTYPDEAVGIVRQEIEMSKPWNRIPDLEGR